MATDAKPIDVWDTLNVALLLTGILTFTPVFFLRFMGDGFFGGVPYLDEDAPLWFETIEKAVVVFSCCLGLALSRCRIQITHKLLASAVSIAASTIVLGAVVSQNEYPGVYLDNEWSKTFFSGFGVTGMVVLILAVATARILPITDESLRERALRVIALLSWPVILIVFLPASIITTSGVPFRVDHGLVLFELLGPLTGKAPLVEVVPQYSSLLGWPLLVLRSLAAPLILDITVLYISILFLVVVALFALILKQIVPDVEFKVFLCIAFGMYLYRPNGSLIGSLTTMPSSTVRMILPMAGLYLLVRTYGSRTIFGWIWVGLVSGLVFFNNFEFGLIYLASVLGLLGMLLLYRRLGPREFIFALGGLLVSLSAFGVALGDRLSRHWLVATQFGSGFGNLLMPRFGLHTLTLSLCVFAIAIGGRIIATRGIVRPSASAIIAFLFGLFALLGHLYFAGRSVVSTQLQTVIPPTALATFAAVMAVKAGTNSDSHKPITKFNLQAREISLHLVMALPLLLFIGLPNPNLEIARLTGAIQNTEVIGNYRYSADVFEGELMSAAQSALEQFGSRNVAILTVSDGAVLALLTDVSNLNIFANFDQQLTWGSGQDLCARVTSQDHSLVIVGGFTFNSEEQIAQIRSAAEECLSSDSSNFYLKTRGKFSDTYQRFSS